MFQLVTSKTCVQRITLSPTASKKEQKPKFWQGVVPKRCIPSWRIATVAPSTNLNKHSVVQRLQQTQRTISATRLPSLSSSDCNRHSAPSAPLVFQIYQRRNNTPIFHKQWHFFNNDRRRAVHRLQQTERRPTVATNTTSSNDCTQRCPTIAISTALIAIAPSTNCNKHSVIQRLQQTQRHPTIAHSSVQQLQSTQLWSPSSSPPIATNIASSNGCNKHNVIQRLHTALIYV